MKLEIFDMERNMEVLVECKEMEQIEPSEETMIADVKLFGTTLRISIYDYK